MRIVAVMTCVLAASLSACSLIGDHNSSEKVNTGYVGPSALNQQQVAQLLKDQGYTHISDLHMNGEDWIGAATNTTGHTVDFDVDKAGVIHTK